MMNDQVFGSGGHAYSLPENLEYYRKTGRFERFYVAGCMLAIAVAAIYFSLLRLLPALDRVGLTSFEFLAVASVLATVATAVCLGLFVAIRVLGPGPSRMRLDAECVRFEFPQRRPILWRWSDPRFRLVIRRLSRHYSGTGQAPPSQIGVRAVFIPHIWLSESALAALLSAAKEHGMRVSESKGLQRGNWLVDEIEVRGGVGGFERPSSTATLN